MEGFLVSARKYRPLRWSDVIGQEHITLTLKNSIAKNQVAHAFLFCGPRGVGKTTCARILARVLNCENPTSEWEPCNICKTCMAFQENNSFNIFEIDAASNNLVDDMRNLVEQIRYQPQQGKYKIYIIDEVHMLTTAAFNAFLKTLEEPPPYAKFILATTEKHKIIPTILSRCQVYDFRRISIKDIIRQLKAICNSENLESEPEALYQIALKADGAMRDALSIFDRIKSYSGKNISYQMVLDNLNILDYDYYFKFLDCFLTEDLKGAFELLDQIIKLGFEPELLLEGLGVHSRNLLVCKNEEMINLLDGSDEVKQRYILQAKNCNQSFILSCLDLINESEINLSKTKNKRLHTEVLIAKLSYWQRRKEQFSNVEVDPNSNRKTVEKKQTTLLAKETNLNHEALEKIELESKKVVVKIPPSANVPSNSIPKLASLDSIKEKIHREEIKRVANLIELNLENFSQFWKNKIEVQKSKTLQEYMKQAKLLVQDNNIFVKVGSILGLESIKSELRLEEEINKIFIGEKIILKVEIDPEMSIKEDLIKPKKLLSAKEKWDIMIENNPLIDDFQKTLELKIDED